jgi:LacI family transcriptional regulator
VPTRPDRSGRVTGYDVARALGMSQSTVSRALRDDPRVVPATREMVKATAAELGYVVPVGARTLITLSRFVRHRASR